MVFTMIAYIIFALSFKAKYGVKFSYYGIIIVLIRQAMRLQDFENTKPEMKDIDWHFLVLYQSCINSAMIPIVAILFQNVKYNKVMTVLCLIWTIVCGATGVLKGQDFEFDSIMIKYTPFYCFQTVVIAMVGRHIPNILELIASKKKQN